MSGPSACLKLAPSTGSTPPVLPWKPPQNPRTSVCPVRDFARRELGEQLDERRAVLGREAAHVNPGELALQRRHVPGVGVPETRDADSREQVDVAVAVHVVQHGPFAAIDGQLAEQRHALGPGSEVPRLEVEQGLRLGTGDLNLAKCMGHGCFRCANRCVMYSAMARAASSRNGAKLGQSLMSMSTGRSGSGNATSPPNTSSPRIAAASNASAFSRFSSILGRSPAKPASEPYQRKNRPSVTP